MLLLARHIGQAIVLVNDKTGEQIRLTIVEWPRHKEGVRVGLEASKTWSIYREEICERYGVTSKYKPPGSASATDRSETPQHDGPVKRAGDVELGG